MTKKSFISGALILMAAGFIVRLLGFVYRIYLSNLIGAEGMGLFQLIVPVYSTIILTLTSGISIAVSKMAAAELARNHEINLRRITSCALVVTAVFGAVASVLILMFIGPIVNVVLKDGRTFYSLLLLVPCIPVISAASAIKGYFYGIQDVTPTAISQIIEQIVRIGLVMVMAGYFLNLGLEYACALATIGMAFGEISNLAVVFVFYKIRKNKKQQHISKTGLMRKRRIIGEILKISLPVSGNRFITSVMMAIELILIPRRFLAGGLDYHLSMGEYGKLIGMAMPLIFFPSLVTSSLSTTIVPALSEAMSLKNFRIANYRISKAFQLTFILGFTFTAIFICYPNEIGDMVYSGQKIGGMLYLLSFTCVFIYIQQMLLGVLNGLGKQGISLRNYIIGSTIRIGFVYFFIPPYGVKGYVWGIIISSALICILNFQTVVETTGITIDIRNWIVKPGIVCLVMVFIGKYIYSFFEIFGLGSSWTIICTVSGNAAVSLSLMVVAGVLDREELIKFLPLKNHKRA